MSTSTPALPRGTYATYKRATSYFLQWLLQARAGGVGAATPPTKEVPLDAYDRIVDAVAAAPTSLRPALLQHMPRALEACECAITLRKRVALFLGDAADDAHAHFVARMSKWFDGLRRALASVPSSSPVERATRRDRAKEDEEQEKLLPPLAFANYYDVLALPEDYFAGSEGDEDDDEASTSTPPSTEKTTASRERLSKNAIASDDDDRRIELECFFLELDELSEGVYAAFLDVKREKKTLVEATVVAKVAIDRAASVIANIQLRYPSVHDGMDFVMLLLNHFPDKKVAHFVATVQKAWMPSNDDTEIRYQYVPGTVLVDIVGIALTLKILVPKTKVSGHFFFRDGAYDERTTRRCAVPEWCNHVPFLLHHVSQLLVFLADLRGSNDLPRTDSLEGWFYSPFNEFGVTGAVSIQLMFVCACWMRSIAALQGNRGLSRTISLAATQLREAKLRIRGYIKAHRDHIGHDAEIDELEKRLQGFPATTAFMRVNPLLTGCVMLDAHVLFLTVANDMLLSSLFLPFCHLYSALCDRRVMDKIPMIEDAIAVYGESVFTTPRAATTCGSFARSYVASNNVIDVTANPRSRRAAAPSSRQVKTTSMVSKGRLAYQSRTVRLLLENDYSALCDAASTSSKELLSAAADLCSDELFGTRVLSRDGIQLAEDLAVLFLSLCEALEGREQLTRLIQHSSRRRALENAVMFALLPRLDKLTDPKLASPGEAEKRSIDMCRGAAGIISRTFGCTKSTERLYFTLPPTPAWISAAFPRPTTECPSDDFVSSEFKQLSKILQASHIPLNGGQLMEFKRRVAATPTVLAKVCTNPKAELWSLLHLAAAGPAYDVELVEWLIQMGALDYELPYWRNDDVSREGANKVPFAKGVLPDSLAVHCAAAKGFSSIVEAILEASYFRDMDTKTLHTKKSLTQIAVETDNKQLWSWLSRFGAIASGTDASGKRIWELTSDREWRAMLKHNAASEERAEAVPRVDPGWNVESETHADRHTLSTGTPRNATSEDPSPESSPTSGNGRDQEAGELGTNSSTTPRRSKSKKRNKKKKSKLHVQPCSVAATSNATGEVREDIARTLSDALDELKANKFATAIDQEECALRVLGVYSHLKKFRLGDTPAVQASEHAARRREVHAAGLAAVLLGSIQHQLHVKALDTCDRTTRSPSVILHELLFPAESEPFFDFLNMLTSIAWMLRFLGITQVAQAVTANIERCLLAFKVRTRVFRRVVTLYALTKNAGRPIAVAHSAVPPELEWYSFDQGVEDEDELDRMDRLFGCAHFMCARVPEGLESPKCVACRRIIDQAMPHGRNAVFVSDCIIAGAKTKQQLDDIVAVVMDAAKRTDLELQYDEGDLDRASVGIWGFEFSATGIVRR